MTRSITAELGKLSAREMFRVAQDFGNARRALGHEFTNTITTDDNGNEDWA